MLPQGAAVLVIALICPSHISLCEGLSPPPLADGDPDAEAEEDDWARSIEAVANKLDHAEADDDVCSADDRYASEHSDRWG